MTKEEVIQNGYGHWFNPHIDENGWFDMAFYDDVFYNDYPKESWDLKDAKLRPKTLRGIENNNGWIKIESEEDLPKEDTLCFIYKENQIQIAWSTRSEFWTDSGSIFLNEVTHYQPIEKPKPPIF